VNLLTAAYLVPIVLFSVMRSSDHDSSCSSILHHSIRLEDKKKMERQSRGFKITFTLFSLLSLLQGVIQLC